LEKLKELNWNIQREMDRSIDDVSFLSLADIEGLKKGVSDPSEELVSGLKKLLHNVADESEIEQHLFRPFMSKSPKRLS